MKKEEYFFEMGVQFGAKIANCSEPSIISLLAERTRMLMAHHGTKEVAEFKRGAATIINYSNKINNEVTAYNNRKSQIR